MAQRNRLWRAVPVGAACLIMVLAACTSKSGTPGSQSSSSGPKPPLVIGASVSLTGDFSDSGKAVKAGYELWASTVNAKGGILGRQVVMKIVDDTSSPTQVVTNYQNLINADHVDLVFGPFSSLLTVPASQVAKRYGYAFLEPAGGGPICLRAEAQQPVLRPARPGGEVRRRLRRLGAVAAGGRPSQDGRLR
jgi:branched-chain amino acid transport system substrate-binding protein